MLMKIFYFLILIACIQIFPLHLTAQEVLKAYKHLFLPARSYVIHQTTEPLIIDGKANELSWAQASWTDTFTDIEGSLKPRPKYQTRVKMLWDSNCIYFLAELEEPNIWSYYKQHDQIVFHENDFELFFDPDGDTQNYFEFELNAANTLFDLFLTKTYRIGGVPLISWNAPGFKSAVSLDGTLNNPTDVDKKWLVEIAIPFDAFNLFVNTQIPADGQIWKVNFSRVQWQTHVVDGLYQKKKDEKTGRFLSEDNWVWNPTGEINMHVPERWGLLQFSTNPVGSEKTEFKMPVSEELKNLLWLVYYKQQDFRSIQGHFATSLSDLSVPDTIQTAASGLVQLSLQATNLQYTVMLTAPDGQVFSLNDEGLIRTIHK